MPGFALAAHQRAELCLLNTPGTSLNDENIAILNEVAESLAALIALAGDGSRLNDLSDSERRRYFSLAGRLLTQQAELVATMV